MEIPVSGSTNAKQLAGAIRARYKENRDLSIHLVAMGISAVSACVKGVVELNKLMSSMGYYVTTLPAMEDRMVSDRRNPDGARVERTVTILYLTLNRLGG